MTSENNPQDTNSETRERRDGRHQGQGWYLEDETESALQKNGYRSCKRVTVWKQEVDLLASPSEIYPIQTETPPPSSPPRVVVSCVDWFQKSQITPTRLWRLIAIAFTVRAEPVLVYNHRTQLTKPAQQIAEEWRVRLVTDKDFDRDWVLPRPEEPDEEINPIWPSPLLRGIKARYMRRPDYSLPEYVLKDDRR